MLSHIFSFNEQFGEERPDWSVLGKYHTSTSPTGEHNFNIQQTLQSDFQNLYGDSFAVAIIESASKAEYFQCYTLSDGQKLVSSGSYSDKNQLFSNTDTSNADWTIFDESFLVT